jgi:hypothetical protein
MSASSARQTSKCSGNNSFRICQRFRRLRMGISELGEMRTNRGLASRKPRRPPAFSSNARAARSRRAGTFVTQPTRHLTTSGCRCWNALTSASRSWATAPGACEGCRPRFSAVRTPLGTRQAHRTHVGAAARQIWQPAPGIWSRFVVPGWRASAGWSVGVPAGPRAPRAASELFAGRLQDHGTLRRGSGAARFGCGRGGRQRSPHAAAPVRQL